MRTRSILRSALIGSGMLVASSVLASCGPDTTWRTAFDADPIGWMMNVGGTSDTSRIAVGGSFDQGRAMHYDGSSWTERDVPAGMPLLNWVQAFGAPDTTEAWAVGANGVIAHWDGATWTAEESPTDQDLWGVWGESPDDLWAVGGTARPSMGGPVPTILHRDATGWTSVEVPTLNRDNVDAFFKVWGSAADDVYVVGDKGVVLHWDGAVWTAIEVGATDDLVAVWGTGPDDIVLVGGRSNGIISHWDGAEWRTEPLSPLPGLNGVWMRVPGIAHAVGAMGVLVTIDVATFEVIQEPVAESFDFHAVHGLEGRLVAVGGNLAVPGTARGIAYRRDLLETE